MQQPVTKIINYVGMHIHVKTIKKSKETISAIFGKAVTPGVGGGGRGRKEV